MKLHVFNPEHDIALASNKFNFIAPHAGRDMRTDLGFLPALWAADGDVVLVDDVNVALDRKVQFQCYVHDVTFVSYHEMKELTHLSEIEPWGWDRALRFQLQKIGVPKFLLPTDEYIDSVRCISHRWWACQKVLKKLVELNKERIGSSILITNVNQLDDIDNEYIIKSPWSGSGRGVRYVNGITKHQRGWAKNIIACQGSVTLEPYYHRIKDFAAEFYAYSDHVEFIGLSIFRSSNGAYAGNIIISEEEKQEIISQYIPFHRVWSAIEDICDILNDEMVGKYVGAFGIDMMIVDENGIKLHPCVELNLRRTMGHVALALQQIPTTSHTIMQIIYNNGYHFRVQPTAEINSPSLW